MESRSLSAGRAMMILLVAASLALSGADARGEQPPGKTLAEIRGSATLAEIERDYRVPASWMIERLKLPPDTPVEEPLKTLRARHGFEMEAVRGLVREYRAEKGTAAVGAKAGHEAADREARERMRPLTPWILALYGLFCIGMLPLLGKNRVSRPVRWSILAASVALFGILFRGAVQPFHSIVQLFQSLGMARFPLGETLPVFLAFALMTFLGVKLVCGWGCPAGTLQELLYDLPVLKSVKTKRAPFRSSNGVRIAFFLVFTVFVFGWIPGLKDQSIYRYFNPFKLFEWNFGVASPVLVLLIFGISIVHYRFFCMWICPFGLFSWLVQDLGVHKVRIDRGTCIDCGVCVRACPTDAAKGIYEGETFSPDCFSCARCLPGCPNGSIRYGRRAGDGDTAAGA